MWKLWTASGCLLDCVLSYERRCTFQAASGSSFSSQGQQMCNSKNKPHFCWSSRCTNSSMRHPQSFSHQVKGDPAVPSHLFAKSFSFFLVTSYMSHFFSQSCWVSHMLLWTWWKVSVQMAAIMAALLERCPTCLLYPPSRVCFSFLPTSCASLSQPLWESKCVFEAGVWVGLKQAWGIPQKFKWTVPSLWDFP